VLIVGCFIQHNCINSYINENALGLNIIVANDIDNPPQILNLITEPPLVHLQPPNPLSENFVLLGSAIKQHALLGDVP